MNLEKRIETFSALGKILNDYLDNKQSRYSVLLDKTAKIQHNKNPWFTPDNIRTAIGAIANELTEENLRHWTDSYPALKEDFKPFRVGLIFAGNIPLAGFHDFLTVLISGNKLLAKTSSKDPDLIPCLGEIICSVNPELSGYIEFTEGTLSDFDAVIATGSNNSSRYFEYYFSKYPGIIRKNRNSIAILSGDENDEEIEALGKDIFTYFGLGCRNVSKIYIPAGYDITSLPPKWDSYSSCINHSGYANNYDYNKAIFLVNKQKFYDTGYLLIREESKLVSPVSVIHYEYYESTDVLNRQTQIVNENLQCIVSRNHIPFGKSQMPHLWDYADGKDTLEFLLKKNLAGIV
ncbi:MAG TPA: acyl-CoA reductase [Bacteroidales bacterium]|nr:acyl-CoA reductase [Bacteroidales bacterium]